MSDPQRYLVMLDDPAAFVAAVEAAPANVQSDFAGYWLGWYSGMISGSDAKALLQDPARMPSFYAWVTAETAGVHAISDNPPPQSDWTSEYGWDWPSQ